MIRLEKLRTERKKSKRKLALEAGVDPAIISYAENRGFRLYPGQLKKIAPVLGVPEDKAETLLDEVVE